MKILNIPGLDNYVELKKDYKRAKNLLKEPEANREELSIILGRFMANPGTVRILKAEFGSEFSELYGKIEDLFYNKVNVVGPDVAPAMDDYNKSDNYIIDLNKSNLKKIKKIQYENGKLSLTGWKSNKKNSLEDIIKEVYNII